MARDLAAIWIYFADTACRDYSPLYDRISRAVAASDAMLDFLQEAPPTGHQPIALLAAVHYLLLADQRHPLAAVYAGGSDADPAPLFIEHCLAHRDEVLELLATRNVNTNEVGRSALLGPALATVGARCGAPLALVDVGCSAGLSLSCDRYLLDYGAAGVTGPADAQVRLSCAVVNGSPPIAAHLPPITARIGIDRSPVDVTDDDAVRWLLACMWPDTGRLERTRLALEELRQSPPRVVAGDAADAVGSVVATLPSDAFAVVMTTWMLMYLSVDERAAFRDALVEASRTRPLAWISGEIGRVVDLFADARPPRDDQGLEASILGLAVFRDGLLSDSDLLAFVHPHGNWIDWRSTR
ncbi:MAG TPA: DUF2332 domain-containing protein [Acidimicrobiia bacterium]|nr:DUF2332 domain-containing protein [Acidimicrobiia bacterium]